MLDFTSALYLGLQHPSWSLRPWTSLTTGVPAALALPPRVETVARELAALQGCERAALGTSTLHLFWDLFGQFPPRDFAVYLDDRAYAIARWGVERAAARGVRARRFAHYDPRDLRGQLRRDAAAGRRPVVVADGFCPSCGRSAPVRDFWEIVRSRNGYLVLDDTQALGIFGHSATHAAPYGRGGGGSLKRASLVGPEVVLISSLAKGFGCRWPYCPEARVCPRVRGAERDASTVVRRRPRRSTRPNSLAMNRIRTRCGAPRPARPALLVAARGDRAQRPAGCSRCKRSRDRQHDVSRLHRDLLARSVQTVLHGARARRPRNRFHSDGS